MCWRGKNAYSRPEQHGHGTAQTLLLLLQVGLSRKARVDVDPWALTAVLSTCACLAQPLSKLAYEAYERHSRVET